MNIFLIDKTLLNMYFLRLSMNLSLKNSRKENIEIQAFH